MKIKIAIVALYVMGFIWGVFYAMAKYLPEDFIKYWYGAPLIATVVLLFFGLLILIIHKLELLE